MRSLSATAENMRMDMMRFNTVIGALGALAASGFGSAAFAQAEIQREFADNLPVIGAPVPNGVNFQPAVTEIARDIVFLDTFLLVVITVIALFVTALLGWVIIRYNAKRNPEPARFTHNTPLEIAWTLVPVLILVVIGSLSLPILFKQLNIPEPDLTIKVTGYQWYWGYEYPDEGIYFDSFMLQPDQLADFGYGEELYQLATDTAMVVPVDATVRMQVTAADVIHSWKINAFGVHMDAVPGRLNETWFRAEEEGVYFGMCSELCGINHAYMPITVMVVSQEEYDAWLTQARDLYAEAEIGETIEVAAAE
ncbi:MAG: cytochrome c oxidase subunit II [Rubricella sp.]